MKILHLFKIKRRNHMIRKPPVLLVLLVVFGMVIGGCAPAAAPTEAQPVAPTDAQPAAPTEAQPAAPEGVSLGLPGKLEGKSWDQIVSAASGQEVAWWMWGGFEPTNNWVNGWFADQLKQKYNITLKQVPVAEATEFVNQVMGEKSAGKDDGGTVDMMWINGENFRTMKSAGLLYGPWSTKVPSGQYYNWNDPAIGNDMGYPVDGHEMPWGYSQMVIEYDSAKITDPPKDMPALIEWIKANPGKFTYPAPPDFTGSQWVRMMCYYATGGYEQFMGEFNQELFDKEFPKCWSLLNELEPYLWREGETYPADMTQYVNLFANGEISFGVTNQIGEAQTFINSGTFPETVRTYVLDDGTIISIDYTAIPYNAAHLEGALVAANFLASPEAQLEYDKAVGNFDPMWLEKVPADVRAQLEAIDRGPATLTMDILSAHTLPELQGTWLTAIEQGWKENVLQK
jgi:putative spermidine/putrescine transport system substrate-binding protein